MNQFDKPRKVPMSEDMLVSRMRALAVLVAIPLCIWLLFEGWHWFHDNVLWA